MRLTLATIVLAGLPAVVMAQTSVSMGPPPSPTLPSIGLPLPSITFPLPQISGPLPTIGLPPVGDARSRFGDGQRSSRPDNAPQRFGSRRGSRSTPAAIFFVPAYGWGYPPAPQPAAPMVSVPDTSPTPPEPARPTGWLRLDVQPAALLQLFVDGYYVGTHADVGGELDLDPGPHRIEIRAPGYETFAFDVKIAVGRLITYRGTLKPEVAGPPAPDSAPITPAPVIPATPTTFFYIPGCYIGNVPPEDVALPPTCDLSRLITRKP
jgi:hypothetical protein